MDIDRRYYNKNTGAGYNDFANINLQPGYQRVTGGAALDFVRFRHTDSTSTGSRASRSSCARSSSRSRTTSTPLDLPKIVSTITKNVEVGGNYSRRDGAPVRAPRGDAAERAFPPDPPRPHQIAGTTELSTSEQAIQDAVQRVREPGRRASPRSRTRRRSGRRSRRRRRRRRRPTVTVLNGNGVAGAAANASYLLGQRGYVMTAAAGRWPSRTRRPRTTSTPRSTSPRGSPARRRRRRRSRSCSAPADVKPMPADGLLRALDPGSMLLVALGQTFHNDLTPRAGRRPCPCASRRSSAPTPAPRRELLEPLQKRVPFPLQVPTVLERSSYPDTHNGDKPVRLYYDRQAAQGRAARLPDRRQRVLGDRGDELGRRAGARGQELPARASAGARSTSTTPARTCTWPSCTPNGASYWVVNTLLDSLSNETMLAIAKGLKPLAAAK